MTLRTSDAAGRSTPAAQVQELETRAGRYRVGLIEDVTLQAREKAAGLPHGRAQAVSVPARWRAVRMRDFLAL